MAQYYHAVFTFLGAIWGANLIALWIGASQPTSLLKICIATLSVISCCLMVATLQQKHWQRELMVLGIQLVIAIPLLFLLRVPSWRTEAEPPMLRPQFSIRSLLVLMIALGVWFTVLSQYHKQMVDVTKWLIAGAIITTTGIITSHQLIRPWNWFRPVVMLGANLFLLSVLLFLSRTDASALNLSLHSTFVVAFFVTVLISTAVGRIANASPKP